MEKSIETIWTEGFMKQDALLAPKLNELYKKKSIHIIDKFKRLGKRNLYGIAIGACLLLIASIIAGVPFAGLFLFLLLIVLVMVGIKQGKELEKIDNTVSSYEYLKSFDNWLKASISEYGRIYKFFYPLLFIGFTLGFWFVVKESILEKLVVNFPGMQLVAGIPLVGLIGIVVLAIFMGIFSAWFYKWDLEIVYGGIFRKLAEILTEMEELRA